MKKLDLFILESTFLKLTLIISFFVFATAFIPVLGAIFLILTPFIFFIYGTVNGSIKTTAAFFIALLPLLILHLLYNQYTPFIPILVMGLCGLLIARTTARSKSIEKIITYPSLLILFAICFFFIYSSFEQSITPLEMVHKYVASMIDAAIKSFSQLPFSKEDIDFFKDNQQIYTSTFTQIFPTIIVIVSIFIVWINFLIGKSILIKIGVLRPGLTMYASWHTPDHLIWFFIISGGLNFVPYEEINLVALNLFLSICFIYLLQGLAIISFAFQSKNAPVFFRFLFYFFIAVQQFLVIPIAAAGLFDIWVDFRKFFSKDDTTDIV